MNHDRLKNKRILVLTPTLTGGSWVCVEELFNDLVKEFEVLVVGLGEGRDLAGAKTLKVPYYSFEKMNPRFGRNIFFNSLYQIPLQIIAVLQVLAFRPKLVISNGFTPALCILPLLKIFGIPFFVYYGSYLDEWLKSKIIYHLLRPLNFFTNHVFVNSLGSKEGIAVFIDERKITVINHWTDIKRISNKKRTFLRQKSGVLNTDFVLLYVGRFIEEKGLKCLLKLVNRCSDIKNLKIWLAGDGKMLDEVIKLTKSNKLVKYLGFIKDREKLREIYTISDLVWTFADETYVAKPGIESWACGTPIMVPNISAVSEKYYANVKIRNDLFPNSVGWIVNNSDTKTTHKILKEIIENKVIDEEFRNRCAKYVNANHSEKNIKMGVLKIKQYV